MVSGGLAEKYNCQKAATNRTVNTTNNLVMIFFIEPPNSPTISHMTCTLGRTTNNHDGTMHSLLGNIVILAVLMSIQFSESVARRPAKVRAIRILGGDF